MIVFSLFAIQHLLGYFFQTRRYQKVLRTWLGTGIVGVGQRRALFAPGEIALLVYDADTNNVISVQSMRGFTLFARFTELRRYTGLSLEALRLEGIKADADDLRGWRVFFKYSPYAKAQRKGALIQAVEAVEHYLGRSAAKPLTGTPARAAEKSSNALSTNDKAAVTADTVRLTSNAHHAGKVFCGFIKTALVPVLKKTLPSALVGCAVFALLFFAGFTVDIAPILADRVGYAAAVLILMTLCLLPVFTPQLGCISFALAFAAAIITGASIAAQAVLPFLALPVLFILDAQIGGSFILRGLCFGKGDTKTASAHLPAAVFNRLVTVPSALVIVSLLLFIF